MMKPLSITTYYLNNKRKVFPVVLVIALSVLAVTVTAALTGALASDARNDLNFYNKYYTITAEPSVVGSSQMDILEKHINTLENQDGIIKGNTGTVRTLAVFGAGGKNIYFLNASNYEPFLKEVGWKLADGTLPKAGTNEVALSERLMKNKGLVLGSKIGKDVDETDFLSGEYKVVGIFKEEQNILGGIGSFDYINKDSSAHPALTYFIKPKSGREPELVNSLKDLKNEFPGIAIAEPVALGKDLDSQIASVDATVLAVNVILVVIVSISVALLNVIFFMQRANEFGLLAAIGYSKTFIIRKTILEILGIVSIAWVLGMGLAQSIYVYLNNTLYYPKGMGGLNLFETRTLIFSLPVPIAVIIFGVGIVLWTLVRMDPISIIEKRD